MLASLFVSASCDIDVFLVAMLSFDLIFFRGLSDSNRTLRGETSRLGRELVRHPGHQ